MRGPVTCSHRSQSSRAPWRAHTRPLRPIRWTSWARWRLLDEAERARHQGARHRHACGPVLRPALERCGALAASGLTAPTLQAAHTVVHVPPARRASFDGPSPSAARELDFPVSHGLTGPEADRLLRLHGRNELEERSKPKWLLFLEQFIAPMPVMLWLACLIELLIQDWTDFWILLSLQLINASVSFYEASRAGDAVAALKAALKPAATAKRDGRWVTLAAAELVPGDLVMLGAGAAVPADCVVNGGAIDVDQAALTGESLPVAMCAGDRPKMGSTVRRMAHAVLLMFVL